MSHTKPYHIEENDGIGQYELVMGESGKFSRFKRRKKSSKTSKSGWYYIGYIGEIGFTIAIPIAGGALLGTVIDQHWSTYPKATLSLLLVGIVVSIIGFVRTVIDLVRRP